MHFDHIHPLLLLTPSRSIPYPTLKNNQNSPMQFTLLITHTQIQNIKLKKDLCVFMDTMTVSSISLPWFRIFDSDPNKHSLARGRSL